MTVCLDILAEKLGLPKLNLRHAKADTTANEYMQELPESVKKMVGFTQC